MSYELVDQPETRYEFVDEPKSSATLAYERMAHGVHDRIAGYLGLKPMTPEQERAWALITGNGWGTGLPKFAYEKGGQTTDFLAGRVSPELAAGGGAAADALIQALPSMVSPAKGLVQPSPAQLSSQALASQRQAVLSSGRDLGLVAPPTQVNPGPVNRLLESIGGKAATAQQAAVNNENMVYQVAQREAGLAPSQPLNAENLEAARNVLAGPYREVTNLQGAGPFSRPPFKSPAETLEALKDARAEAKAQWDYYERSKLPQALRDSQAATAKAEAIELALEQQAAAAGRPDLVEQVRKARVALAKNYTVERAMRGSSFDPAALSRMEGSNTPLSGDLEAIMQMYRDFPQAMKAPQVGGSVGVSQLMPWLGGSAGGVTGAILHGPAGAGLGSMAGIIAGQTVPPLARSLILSRPYQSLFANVPQGPTMTAPLLRALGANPSLMPQGFGALYQ